MENKLYVFGSCFSHGLELWEEAHIDNYKDMDIVMATVRTNLQEYWRAFHHDTRDCSKELKDRIKYNRTHAWPSFLEDAEVKNFSAVGQRNLETYLKIISMLDNGEIDPSIKLIIEITQPADGKTISYNETVKSVSIEHAEYFFENREMGSEIKDFYKKYESDRFNAWNDLLILESLFNKLKNAGIQYRYFFYDRSLWYALLKDTKPFQLYIDPDTAIKDNFDKLLHRILSTSLLNADEDLMIRSFECLPHEHLSALGHKQLADLIKSKLKDF